MSVRFKDRYQQVLLEMVKHLAMGGYFNSIVTHESNPVVQQGLPIRIGAEAAVNYAEDLLAEIGRRKCPEHLQESSSL